MTAPAGARQAVVDRDGEQCQHCGRHGTDWHHRRRRSASRDHRDCPCNGVYLCSADHHAFHQSPEAARAAGHIVSSYEPEPWAVPLLTPYGWRLNLCDGGVRYLTPDDVEIIDGRPALVDAT